MVQRILPRLGFTLSSLFFSLSCSDLAWAASDAHGGGSSLLTLGFFAINFLIFAFVIRRFTRDLIRRKLKERHETVVQALEEAKKAKEEADRLRQEYDTRLANLAAEEEELRSQAVDAAERERQRLMEEAQQMAERAKTEAQLIAQREVEEARRTLRQEVATQAVAIATELIQRNVTRGDNRRLVEQLVQEVRSAENTGS
jgi:F-type H+-transporting ATPase subunit b